MALNNLVVNGTIALPSSRQILAALGNYWVATNPAPGTAIAYANKSAFSATANGLFLIQNKNPVGGANIQLDRLRLTQTATAPSGGLVTRFELYQELGIVAMSGNALAVTPVNLNAQSPNTFPGTVTFFSAGAGTIPAAVLARNLLHPGAFATGVNVQHDSWTFEFGSDGQNDGVAPLTAARATDPADLTTWTPPVLIAPQTSLWMNLWGLTPATNVPSYEFALSMIVL